MQMMGPGAGPSKKGNQDGRSSSQPNAKMPIMLGDSMLEREAAAMIEEVAYAVQMIAPTAMLAPSPDLIFLNVTTLDGYTYCVELTKRGWRVASEQHNSMHGDYRQLQLHTRYYESIQALLSDLSPRFRERFAGQLSGKLDQLSNRQHAQ